MSEFMDAKIPVWQSWIRKFIQSGEEERRLISNLRRCLIRNAQFRFEVNESTIHSILLQLANKYQTETA